MKRPVGVVGLVGDVACVPDPPNAAARVHPGEGVVVPVDPLRQILKMVVLLTSAESSGNLDSLFAAILKGTCIGGGLAVELPLRHEGSSGGSTATPLSFQGRALTLAYSVSLCLTLCLTLS